VLHANDPGKRLTMTNAISPEATQAHTFTTELERELYEALENDVRFFDSIANHEHWEASGMGNLCRGYAARRRDLLAKARGETA
jgi:hypothetical protein